MTKGELVGAISGTAGITKVAAEKAVNAFTGAVTKALKKGDTVSLVGFGTFSVSRRKARKGRNPQTGKEINIPAVKVPKFKAGKILKGAVRKWKSQIPFPDFCLVCIFVFLLRADSSVGRAQPLQG